MGRGAGRAGLRSPLGLWAMASGRPLGAAATGDRAVGPEAGGGPLTLSRDTLVYAIIGVAVVAILIAFFI